MLAVVQKNHRHLVSRNQQHENDRGRSADDMVAEVQGLDHLIVFESAMDLRETDILSDRIERIERRIADIEAQFHNSTDCVSSSINPIIESEASHDQS